MVLVLKLVLLIQVKAIDITTWNLHTKITSILGVDYTHPALGGCFGQGCKFAYGYDLVGNNFNGNTSSIEESNDPIDNCPVNSSKLF